VKIQDPDIIRLSDVEREEVRWLWKGFIPLGKITILEGDPGLGKSTVTIDVAARVTAGLPFPDGTLCEPGNVLMLNAEDDPSDTIRPRLEAAGGNPERAHFVSGTDVLDDLERVVRAIDARLVIIDPLTAYFGKKDSHKDQDVRSMLSPLGIIGQQCGAAILPVRHFNKNSKAPAIYRGAGSIGIGAAARSVLMVAQHPDHSERRLLSVVKSNLAERPRPIEFMLEQVGSTTHVVWLGESQLTEDAIAASASEPDDDRNLESILLEILQEGPIPPKEALARLRDAGFLLSERSVSRARKRFGIKSKRVGFGPQAHYLWMLPIHDTPND
jgi:putative DNA primase/helicase